MAIRVTSPLVRDPRSTIVVISSGGRLSTTNQPRSSRHLAAVDRPAPDSPETIATWIPASGRLPRSGGASPAAAVPRRARPSSRSPISGPSPSPASPAPIRPDRPSPRARTTVSVCRVAGRGSTGRRPSTARTAGPGPAAAPVGPAARRVPRPPPPRSAGRLRAPRGSPRRPPGAARPPTRSAGSAPCAGPRRARATLSSADTVIDFDRFARW